jgi:hypothetical protein
MQSQLRNVILCFAVAVFLLYVGASAYRILYPIQRWTVRCFVKRDGKTYKSGTISNLTNRQQVLDYMTEAGKRGATCDVLNEATSLRAIGFGR